MTADPVQFVRDRLDEEARIARAAIGHVPPNWHPSDDRTEVLWWPPEPRVAELERQKGLPVTSDQWHGATVDTTGNLGLAVHIARHNPARVLADIEAKRHILDGIAGADPEGAYITATFTAMDVLRLLALPYADHPDYREEWRP